MSSERRWAYPGGSRTGGSIISQRGTTVIGWLIVAGDGEATVISAPNVPQPIIIAGDGDATAQE